MWRAKRTVGIGVTGQVERGGITKKNTSEEGEKCRILDEYWRDTRGILEEY